LSKIPDWQIRPYREGDESQIFELWKAAYPERQLVWEPWFRWWHWMYKENSLGFTIWLAEHKGKIVGQYAIVHILMNINGRNTVCAQSLNTLTHPEYRRQGMFETLAKTVFKEAYNKGIHIIYGFPNEKSYPGFVNKLNWFDIASLPYMYKTLNWEVILRKRTGNKFVLKLGALSLKIYSNVFHRISKAPFVSGLIIRQASSFDERINEFWDRVSSQFPIAVTKNKDYLQWRYVSVPDKDYYIYLAEKAGGICGYIVLGYLQQEYKKIALIYDFLTESEAIARCLLQKITGRCQSDSVDQILCFREVRKDHYSKAFSRGGSIPLPFGQVLKFIAYSSASNISNEFLQNPQNWLIQIGDSDQPKIDE